MLYHPGVAFLPCSQCEAMLHDMETGKPVERKRPDGTIYNITPPTHKAPCRTNGTWKCPKGTPETAHEVVLNEKNRRTLKIYNQAKATGFQFVPEFDELLADNFATIAGIYEAFEREQSARDVTDKSAAAAMQIVQSLRKP